MKLFFRHSKINSGLFLFAYLFLFTIGIFHSHQFSWNNNSLLTNKTDSNHAHHDPFSTDGSFCLLTHLNNTLANVNFYPANYSTSLNEIAKIPICDQSVMSQIEFSVVSLRAPPNQF